MPTPEQIVATSVKLVTLPEIFTRVKRVVDDPDTTAIDLALVISADPAMTARVLRLINSAFWGFSRNIESLSRAVSLLGMIQVHDLVLATSVAQTFDGMRPQLMDVAKFWRGCVFRGLAATALARKIKLVDLGRVFTEGLISDIGHMVLFLNLPELAAQALEQTRERPWELAQAERALIGCDAAQVGGALADAWKLPACFGAAIRHLNDPHNAGSHAMEASLLHIAAALAQHQGAARDEPAWAAAITPFAWQSLALTADCLPEIRAEVETSLSATAQLFGASVAGSAA